LRRQRTPGPYRLLSEGVRCRLPARGACPVAPAVVRPRAWDEGRHPRRRAAPFPDPVLGLSLGLDGDRRSRAVARDVARAREPDDRPAFPSRQCGAMARASREGERSAAGGGARVGDPQDRRDAVGGPRAERGPPGRRRGGRRDHHPPAGHPPLPRSPEASGRQAIETITHRLDILRYLDRLTPGRFFEASHGGLGTGLGEALGVKAAAPDRTVIALIGDGALNYNPVLAAFGASQEHRLPILIVIFNNSGYLSQKSGIPLHYPDGWAVKSKRFVGTSIAPRPDYAAVAQAVGGYGETVTDRRQFRAA